MLDPVSTQKRPTELLLEMQALLGQTTPLGPVAESLLRKLFIDKLPPQVRLILAALPELSLEELANKAESIMQVATPSLGQGSRLASQPLSAAEPSPQNLTQMLINQNFDEKMSKLTESMNKLQDLSKATSTTVQEQVPPSNPRYRTPPTSLQSNFRRNPWNYSQRPRQDYRPPKFRNQQFHGNRFNTFNQYDYRKGESVCFYHSTFGDRAHKCTPPCSKANQKKRGKFFPAINVLGKNNTFNARRTFSAYDKQSNFSFLVDSGSDISALPAGWIKPTSKTRKTIYGPTSNSNVSCIGYATLTLDLGF